MITAKHDSLGTNRFTPRQWELIMGGGEWELVQDVPDVVTQAQKKLQDEIPTQDDPLSSELHSGTMGNDTEHGQSLELGADATERAGADNIGIEKGNKGRPKK